MGKGGTRVWGKGDRGMGKGWVGNGIGRDRSWKIGRKEVGVGIEGGLTIGMKGKGEENPLLGGISTARARE